MGEVSGIHFYDDAISTTPESTLAAISVFQDRLGTVILGGLDRGYDFSLLAKVIVDLKVPNLVFFPDSGEKIRDAIASYSAMPASRLTPSGVGRREALEGYTPNMLETSDMNHAVDFCFANTEKGKVCLLSTASPSYSVFKNFEEKGDMFQAAVKKGKLK